MKTNDVVTLLSSLAHPIRLDIFRMLVVAGEEGVAAGAIAEEVGVAPSSLSFHLKELSYAGMIHSRQEGRFVVYTAAYETMGELISFLSANCCDGKPCAVPLPVKAISRATAKTPKVATRRH